jgi:AbrB family looped-hinge helix DNA binding protein
LEKLRVRTGERGRITIPKRMREKLGLLPNTEVEFVEKEDGVLIQKRPIHTSPVRKVYGILNTPGSTDKYIEDIRGR